MRVTFTKNAASRASASRGYSTEPGKCRMGFLTDHGKCNRKATHVLGGDTPLCTPCALRVAERFGTADIKSIDHSGDVTKSGHEFQWAGAGQCSCGWSANLMSNRSQAMLEHARHVRVATNMYGG